MVDSIKEGCAAVKIHVMAQKCLWNYDMVNKWIKEGSQAGDAAGHRFFKNGFLVE
jgi:hypothetical protein